MPTWKRELRVYERRRLNLLVPRDKIVRYLTAAPWPGAVAWANCQAKPLGKSAGALRHRKLITNPVYIIITVLSVLVAYM